jgi:hypothetical protein
LRRVFDEPAIFERQLAQQKSRTFSRDDFLFVRAGLAEVHAIGSLRMVLPAVRNLDHYIEAVSLVGSNCTRLKLASSATPTACYLHSDHGAAGDE